jgi:hypothetical protein
MSTHVAPRHRLAAGMAALRRITARGPSETDEPSGCPVGNVIAAPDRSPHWRRDGPTRCDGCLIKGKTPMPVRVR